jgi:hypothetical protein
MKKRVLPIDARPPLPVQGERIKIQPRGKPEVVGVVDRANGAWIYARVDGPESAPKPFFPSQCSTLQGRRFA